MKETKIKRKGTTYIAKRKKNGTFAVGRWKKTRKKKQKPKTKDIKTQIILQDMQTSELSN